MADKLRNPQQLEQLQARFLGVGHADTTRFEWTSNLVRDSLASVAGHPALLSYYALGSGQARERARLQVLERMVQPVGAPPEVQE